MKTPIKMLYIEDNQLDQQAFLRLIRQQSLPYDLTIADTLAQARACLGESRFDLILADYHLPDGHSTQLFGEVQDTPFILMTGTLDEQLAIRTLERGADDYLPKDPRNRHLEAVPFTVNKVLYRQQLRGVEERLTRELREQDRRNRLAQQANGVGTFEWDIPHNRVTWSPELERLYGLPPGSFGGCYEIWAAHVHPEDRPETERQHQRALTTGRVEAEWRAVWPDGSIHWLAGRATVEMDADGNPLRMLGVNIDITDRKRVEEALHRSEALYRTMARSIPDGGIAVVDRDLRYLTFEGELLPRLGLSKESMEGRTVQEALEGELGQVRAEHFRQALAGEPNSFEREHSGRTLWSQIVPLRDENGQVWAAMSLVLDITERKRIELELAALRDRLTEDLAGMNRLHELSRRFVNQGDLQTLLDAILDAAIGITAATKGNIQLLDTTSGELGITVQRGLDQAFVQFFSHIHASQVACGTAMATRQCVIVEDITLSPLFLVEPRALQLMVATGVRAAVCTPLLTRTAAMVGVLSVYFPTPYHPSERDLRLLDLLARQAADFLERTQAENAVRAAREELVQLNSELELKVQERTAKLQQTVTELEHFSYTITHDMRAPLRAMRGFGSILMEECSSCLHPTRLDFLRRIAEAADRMDNLITDALQFSETLRQEIRSEPVDAGKLLRGILESYPQFQAPQAQIQIAGEMPVILGNRAALTQCFSNLLGNAVKFVQPGSTPEVRVWAEGAQEHAEPGHGQMVRIYFEDKGIGIEKEYQDKIWVMFQQLNKSYEGTGIGLALVRKAVERMGGRVGVESQPGEGSRFWIELAEAAPEMAMAETQS